MRDKFRDIQWSVRCWEWYISQDGLGYLPPQWLLYANCRYYCTTGRWYGE